MMRADRDQRPVARRRATLLALALLAFLTWTSSSPAITLRAGDLVVTADGGFKPTALPKHRDAPITIHGGGKLATVSGTFPPVIESITIEYDRHGHVETRGLGVCTKADLVASTVKAARRRCPGAIVGTGFGRGVVVFPEQAPIPASSPITIFNGPRIHGNPSVLAHFFITVPAPTTFTIPIEIERISKGAYGYRTEARIPPIAGGHGIPLAGHLRIGRKWTHRGGRLSYLNARCATGNLRARGIFGFKDGTRLTGSFSKRCRVRDR